MSIVKIKNWKLLEEIANIQVMNNDPLSVIDDVLTITNLPKMYNEVFGRHNTFIDWDKAPCHYRLFFDNINDEVLIKNSFLKSKVAEYDNLIITYCDDNIVVKVPFLIFIEDWEGFVRSTLYNGLIFTEDFKFVIEITRDYHFHSTFRIQ
ncbi:hypothetical protein BH09BAC1_BH09BAC1_20890 [soil metagenome]